MQQLSKDDDYGLVIEYLRGVLRKIHQESYNAQGVMAKQALSKTEDYALSNVKAAEDIEGN